MITICAVCKIFLREGSGEGVSHGYCNFCSLVALEEGGLITSLEKRKLNAMRLARRRAQIKPHAIMISAYITGMLWSAL